MEPGNWSKAERANKDGTRQLSSRRAPQQTTPCVCPSDACPSGQGSKTSIQASPTSGPSSCAPPMPAAASGPAVGESMGTSLLRIVSQLFVLLWVLWTWARRVFKARCFRDLSQIAGLKSWGAWCRVWILCSSKRSSRFWAPSPLWVAAPGLGFMRLSPSFSYPFQCQPSFIRCFRVVQSVFRFFSEEVVLYVAVDPMWTWDEFRISYVAILNWNPTIVLLLCTGSGVWAVYVRTLSLTIQMC